MLEKAEKPFLRNLNGLRFLAASYTIGFHYFLFPNNTLLNRFFSRGHISVPFFFLLSGFVLSYSYGDYNFETKGKKTRYWISRWIRLAPIYYIALALALPLLYLHLKKISFSTSEIIFNTINHLTLTQGFFASNKIISFWNTHSWSLSVEFFLYLMSPFLIALGSRIKKNHLIPGVIGLILLNTVIFYLSFSPFHIFEKVTHYFPPYYLGVFFIGVLLSRIFLNFQSRIETLSNLFFSISISTLLVSFFLDLDSTFYSTFNPLFLCSFSLLILASCKETALNKFLGSKPFFLLGEASYAMYIFQAPIKLYTQQFLSKILGFQESSGFIYAFILFTSIASFSYLVSFKIDPTLRKLMRKKLLKN